VSLAGLVVVSWRRAPRTADAVIGLGASYFSVSNVLVASSAIADRLLFFPSMWLVAIVALVGDRALRTSAGRRVACLAALGFAAVQMDRAAAYGSLWRDDLTLLGGAANAYPNVYRTQRNLAHALSDAHDDEAAAWHLAVAEAIYGHFPVRVARDAISPAWDAEPLNARLAHLRALFGARATCAAAGIAQPKLVSWESPAGADALARWTRLECGPAQSSSSDSFGR
jgi:hypothetical protein